MKPYILLVRILCFSIIVLLSTISCSKLDELKKDKNLAVENIENKNLTLYNYEMKYILKAFDFTSYGSCDVKMIASDILFTQYPKYTYTQLKDNQAKFYVKYSTKWVITSSVIITGTDIYDVDLVFTSSTEGTYSGTSTYNSDSRSIYGTFTLY